ncbi:MAG: arginine--tRNA ligase [Candidatus Niyogibacteria bacterium]|nr:arginine--tRNA ligase [Candidatus Niyogibacteria bacterium]
MMRNYVKTALKKVAPDISFSITIPEQAEHGDYMTNAAFLLAQKEKNSPKEIAEKIVKNIDTELFEKIEIAGNGFINFFLKKELLYKELAEVLDKKESYGKGAPKNEKVNIEFISANPTGPITLGNGRGAFLGDALANILKYSGLSVESDFYVNDAKVGGQVQSLGKAIKGEDDAYPYIRELYFKDNPEFLKELEKLSAEEAGFKLAQIIHKKNEETLKKIDIHIDTFFHEQTLYDNKKIEEIKKLLSEKKLGYQKDGALWLKTSKFGDDKDKVLIRSTGAPTYLLADLAYHWDKFTKRKFDTVINILGADHHGTIQSFKAALKALGIEKNRFTAIITQTVRFMEDGKERKMSKRKGEFVTFEDLINEVGTDAARYFFLEKSPDTHMDFDIGLARERSAKNPVYYIQYAHARISSILKNAGEMYDVRFKNYALLKESEEFALIKKMGQFPEIIEDTARDYQVHRITRYAYELAQRFHDFYEKHRVITGDKELTQARLALISACRISLQNTLYILGISTPEKM